MNNIPSISDAEWEVMEVLWNTSPLQLGDIAKKLNNSKWSTRTVQTLVRRLVQKNALGIRKENGKIFLYYPLVSREECQNARGRTFINKFFDGSVSQFLTAFYENENLTEEDRKKLMDLLNRK